MSSFTAAGIMGEIENFCSIKKNVLSSQQFLEKVYTCLFWLIFSAMIGAYVGALSVGALKSIELQMSPVSLIICLGSIGFKIFSLGFKNFELDLLIALLSGLAMAFLWEGATSGDPGFIADILLNVSLTICSFRISLILRHISWIIIISGLGMAYLLFRTTLVDPSFIIGVPISLAVLILVLYRNALLETGHIYFIGILLTWLITDFLVPCFIFGWLNVTKYVWETISSHPIGVVVTSLAVMICFFDCNLWLVEGAFVSLMILELLLIWLIREYSGFENATKYVWDTSSPIFPNNYFPYHFYLQLGLLFVCGSIIYQTQLINNLPDLSLQNYYDHTLQIFWNLINMWRFLIDHIITIFTMFKSFIF